MKKFLIIFLVLFSTQSFAQISDTTFVRHPHSQEQKKDILLNETKEGGKLDFFSGIKGHEYDSIQIKPGIFTTKLGAALAKWSQNSFNLGIIKVDDVFEVWNNIKGRPANQKEKDYIISGFKKQQF